MSSSGPDGLRAVAGVWCHFSEGPPSALTITSPSLMLIIIIILIVVVIFVATTLAAGCPSRHICTRFPQNLPALHALLDSFCLPPSL